MYVNVKKLVRTGTHSYQIGWHRDALRLQVMGVDYKGFCVGAVYVNRPENITSGGEIQFARNTARFGIAPPSGTSVTFLDDEVFHKVTPVQAPEGVEYVPRSAFFLIYLTDENGPFKKSIVEQASGLRERNYSSFLRTTIPLNVMRLLNKRSPLTTEEKARLNQAATQLFQRSNAYHGNLKTLYNNMKRTLGHEIYENANIKRLLNRNTLTNDEKTVLNQYARAYFGTKNASHVNLKARYNNLKEMFGGAGGGLGTRTTNNLVSFVRVLRGIRLPKIRRVRAVRARRANNRLAGAMRGLRI
jgi:hypothetical protein